MSWFIYNKMISISPADFINLKKKTRYNSFYYHHVKYRSHNITDSFLNVTNHLVKSYDCVCNCFNQQYVSYSSGK